MNRQFKSNQGFTLAELLIVVAIVLVLTGVAIPVFTGTLEKSREATDVANARSATSMVADAAMLKGAGNDTIKIDAKGTYYTMVPLVQKQEGWQTESLNNSDPTHWVGKPKPDASAKVTCTADGNIVVYWDGGNGYTPAVVADSAKDYTKAINAVLSTLYNDIVSDRLSNDKNHISWVLIRNGKVQSAACYTSESDKGGGTSAKLTQKELDDLNANIAKSLNGTGYKLSTNSTARVFFDWDGNVISNDRANGAPAIGGQGAYATIDFMPENGNKKQTVTNSTGEWSL